MRKLAALTLVVAIALFGVPAIELGAQTATGEVLAIVGRQVVRISLAGLRPRQITALAPPANAQDVAVLPGTSAAVISVTSPDAVDGIRGGDLLTLDLATGATAPLLGRAHGGESLLAPAWLPDGSGVLFQREDYFSPLVAPPGHEVAHYPSRLEYVAADGSGRVVLAADGQNPGSSPDGAHVAFARTTNSGNSLHTMSRVDWTERVVVPEGLFLDLAFPRYSPSGTTIAFVGPRSGATDSATNLMALFQARPAFAHSFPWSLWAVDADGSNLRLVAELYADEPSLDWSPDGTRVFVYGISGAFVVEVASGAVVPYPRLLGSGAVSWVAD